MRWKIYFWIITALFIAVTFDLLFKQVHEANIFIWLHTFLLYSEIVGLFAYIFNKHIFTKFFWKCFFWFGVVLESFILLYSFFPYLPILNFFGVFFLKVHITYVARAVGTSIEIFLIQAPLLYAMYRLSQGKFYEEKVKPKKVTKVSQDKKHFQWGMVQMALWGYSSVITFFFFVLSLFPQNGSDKTSDQTYETILFVISIIFLPIFIFWLWVVIRYKKYKWNWWRTTLVANALVLSGTTVFSVFDPQQSQTSSGFDFVGMLQIVILLVSLYVFGKEQFYIKDEQILIKNLTKS